MSCCGLWNAVTPQPYANQTHICRLWDYQRTRRTQGTEDGAETGLGWGSCWIRGKLLSCACLWVAAWRERGTGQWLGQSGLQCSARWRDCPRTFALSRRLVHIYWCQRASKIIFSLLSIPLIVKIAFNTGGTFLGTWTHAVCNVSGSAKISQYLF